MGTNTITLAAGEPSDEVGDDLCARCDIAFLQAHQGDVGAVDARHERARLWDAERMLDAFLRAGAGGCCEREHRRAAELAAHLGDAAVVGTEVVAPAVNEVRLVDDQKARSLARDARSPQRGLARG